MSSSWSIPTEASSRSARGSRSSADSHSVRTRQPGVHDVKLMSRDVGAAASFYRDLFGFDTTFPSDWYVSLRLDAFELAILARDRSSGLHVVVLDDPAQLDRPAGALPVVEAPR